jgi:hypothetical protein
MGQISEESLVKMKDYISARNNPERLRMVELVANYLLGDLPEELEKEEALILAKYHLSTDKGIEDLEATYPEALAAYMGDLEEAVSVEKLDYRDES